ncbi:MAG: hypothetical protein E6G01_03920 [Actinobacteria bacterium]|nr:MAG: hypothetical protein E6G01_03920 [Actinomycetota bacterium]
MLWRPSAIETGASMSSPQWLALRGALGETAGRFARLLVAVGDPDADARAVGTWSVGDVAAHVHEVSIIDSWFVTGEEPAGDLRELYDMATTASVDRVRDLNALALRLLPERSPRALASLVEANVGVVLEATAAADGDEQIAWLGGTKVPLRAVLGHMLSRLILETFLLELLRSPDAARFGGDRSSAPKPVACELRPWGAEPVLVVAGDDGLAVRPPDGHPVDARISADPATLWLVMCHRTSALRAVLTRSVVVSGPRPWRLRRLARLLRTP